MQQNDRTSSDVILRPGAPDGKRVSGVMLDLYERAPRGAVAEPRRQLLAEYFASMLVLSASFRYESPVGSEN